MPLDINNIKPKNGTMHCYLWENDNINLPLTMYYSIEIPLEPFDSGHDYVEQPCETLLAIEWILFRDNNGQQIKNWKSLVKKEFQLSYEDETAEGSIYLGSEHCQFNSYLRFTEILGTTLDIDLKLAINFNIDTVNLPSNGLVHLKTKVNFQGLLLYPPDNLPTFKNIPTPLTILEKFIDPEAYERELNSYKNPNVNWGQLKPKR